MKTSRVLYSTLGIIVIVGTIDQVRVEFFASKQTKRKIAVGLFEDFISDLKLSPELFTSPSESEWNGSNRFVWKYINQDSSKAPITITATVPDKWSAWKASVGGNGLDKLNQK